MLSSLSATAYTCLTVAMFVTEPSHIHLTVQDHVRVDRITDVGVEQHGNLVPPGTTSVYLAEGTYLFRTGRDAQVRLDDGSAVRVVAMANDKDGDFPDPSMATGALPDSRGDTAPYFVPTLTVCR